MRLRIVRVDFFGHGLWYVLSGRVPIGGPFFSKSVALLWRTKFRVFPCCTIEQ
jgi:hypothetical protein